MTDQTKWVTDHADFTGLMHEFRYHEKSNCKPPVARTQRQPKKKPDMNEFFNYLIDDGAPFNEDQEDFETTCKIKDEGDRMITKQPLRANEQHYFDNVLSRY